ncbi:hypothetical protein CLOM_g24035 [Closterium sp. NIES-68]|nr:hypothetical protein CLOM_g24035 [Closterium sp. NIES-68]GJP67316.1 hypothetical protein CLOP_g24147 [Closterium sp. NIES-67]
MAHAVAASSFTAALAPASGSFAAAVQRKTVTLRTVPCAAARRCNVTASLSPIEKQVSAEEILSNVDTQKTVAASMAGSLFALLSNVGSAAAVQEIATIADSDNRAGSLLIVLLPAIGWVLFNILRPALNQLDKMKGARGIAATAGLGAAAGALLAPEQADAAQQIAQLADSDNRAGALLIVILPALGWVLFNILRPALNQLDKMKGKKGVAAALGLGAAGLLAAPHAEAAQQIAELADSDNRAGALLIVILPALGWVLFNILKPGLNQLNKMKGKSVVGALGLGAAGMLVAPHAEAAQQIAELADSDNRAGALLIVLLPALGWVLFNILQPAKNQLAKMKSSKSVVGAAGIGAASAALLAAAPAEAAQQIAQLADSDNRAGALLIVLLPALGWVLFNILRPGLNQLNKMKGK